MPNSKFQIPNSYLLLVAISLILVFFGGLNAEAAQIFFETNNQEIIVNQQFEVALKLDTQNQAINALEGEILVNNLKLISINDGDSFVNLWIQRPIEKDRNIIFSGIIPGGYTGNLNPNLGEIRPGNIVKLIFVAEKTGVAQLIFAKGRVLLNDGQGTEASLFVYNLQLNAVDKGIKPEAGIIENRDTISPEPFAPQINHDPNIFDNKWFLVFKARDNQSGIDHYDVLERKEFDLLGLKFKMFGSWFKTESPYLLKDQKLKSYIYVKAVDRANNEKIAVVPPRVTAAWYENYLIWFIIILSIILIYGFWKYLWKKRVVH